MTFRQLISIKYEFDGLCYLYCGDQSAIDAFALTYHECAIHWHVLLVHASLKSIKLLIPSLSLCHICGASRATLLKHTDILEPTRIKSVCFAYFVTFIDDYSQMT